MNNFKTALEQLGRKEISEAAAGEEFTIPQESHLSVNETLSEKGIFNGKYLHK